MYIMCYCLLFTYFYLLVTVIMFSNTLLPCTYLCCYLPIVYASGLLIYVWAHTYILAKYHCLYMHL